ncbi:MAG: hypothetical protein U0797_09010 [Gemmataceae bacterium]
MANKPEDPQRPHPDDPNKPPQDSDSAIDFSELNEEDMSGISVIEWASLVENPSKAGIDVPPRPPEEPGEAIDLGGFSDEAAGQKVQTGSDSSIDLGSSEVSEPVSAGDPHAVNLASVESIDLGDPHAAVLETGGPSDVVELGIDALAGSGPALPDEDEPIDLDMSALVPEGHSGTGQSAIDLAGGGEVSPARGGSSSSVNFDEDVLLEPAKGGSSGSKRDFIAEGLESGVGLVGSPQKGGPAAEDEDDFLAHAGTEAGEETSSVDLGSMHSVPVFDVEEEARASGRAAADEDEAIDLTAPAEEEPPARPVKGKAQPAAAPAADLDAAEEIEAVEEPEERPAAAKPRRRVGAFAGVGVVSALAGAAAMFGAVSLDLVPGGGSPPPKGGGGTPPPQMASPPAAVAGFDKAMDHIRTGDLDKVAPEDLDRAEEAKAEQLVARAEYHWLSYLRKERGANPAAPVRADADEVKKALADLEKAAASPSAEAAADALFLRGQIHEATGNLAAARTDYAAGAAKLPARKAQFDTALHVLDLTTKVGRLAPPALNPAAVALALLAFQPPMGDAPPAGAAPLPQEAGLSFWRAVVAARENKFGEAVKLIDQARADHDRRRYLLPKKPLNPTSDPTEKVFLRACDLLKEHWLMQERLSSPGYLTGKDRIPQVDALLARATEAAGAAALKDVAARLVKDRPVASADDLVKLVEADRKEKLDRIAALMVADQEQKKQINSLDGNLKAMTATLTKARDALEKTGAALAQEKADGSAALAALKEVAAAAGSDFKDVKASKGALVRDVAQAAKVARTTDPKGSLREMERALAAGKERLAQRWEPSQMLSYWLPLLDGQRERNDLAAGARKDAERVQADPDAKPEDQARALLVEGLALRNEEKYAEAVPVLKKAAAGLQGDELRRAEAALREAAAPAATAAGRAAELESQGNRKEALALLERALKTLPDPKGPLYVQRARVALAEARAKGALAANDPLVAEARRDAERARTAEGAYLLGRIAEELGNPAEAVGHYRTALRAHNQDDAQGSRYRIALARALLRARPGAAPVGPRTLPPPTRTGMLPLDLVGLMAVTLQGPGVDADATEAERLADQVLADKNAPFDARAQALAIKGLHTRAVRVYVTGLRDKGRLPADEANTLLSLVEEHPALRRPESKATPDPMLSERHYGAGLNFFFARKYADAERELLAAIENDSSDARYSKKSTAGAAGAGQARDAAEDFDQGPRLSRPAGPTGRR